MKDYCPKCTGDMDEVDFEYGMCYKCFEKKMKDSLLKSVDDDFSFWIKAFVVMIFSIPIIYIILTFFMVM